MKNLVTLVAVRAGSQRVKNKNIRSFSDSNLLEIKLNQLKKVAQIDEIIVNSDCDNMLDLARKMDVTAVKRDEKFATNEVGMSDVYKYFAEVTEAQNIMYANVTNPFVEEGAYKKAILRYFTKQSAYDSLVSCHPIKEFLWSDGQALNYDTKNQPRSQDLPDILALNFAISIIPRTVMLERRNIIGANPDFFVLDEIESVDIDTELDFYLAEKLYNTLKINKDDLLESQTSKLAYVFFDFDGVIVDSVPEAYATALISSGKVASLSDVDLNSKHAKKFMDKRYLIGPAWNYFYLLEAIDKGVDDEFENYLPGQPNKKANSFMMKFFETRARLRKNEWDHWLTFNRKYDGVNELLSILDENENTCIVTTKDSETVGSLLELYGVTRAVDIYDNKDYEEYGCKSYLIDKIISDKGIDNAILVEDSKKHLNSCKWINNIELVYATWGYVPSLDYKNNKDEVINLVKKYL